MSVHISPVGLSAAPVANQLSILATFKERLCQSIPAVSNNQPIATVSYTAGQPVLNGTTVFIPITASIQITSPTKCCKANVQMCTERFMVAFQGRTTLPTGEPTITSVGTQQSISCVKNGEAYGYVINDSLTIAIGASSTAS